MRDVWSHKSGTKTTGIYDEAIIASIAPVNAATAIILTGLEWNGAFFFLIGFISLIFPILIISCCLTASSRIAFCYSVLFLIYSISNRSLSFMVTSDLGYDVSWSDDYVSSEPLGTAAFCISKFTLEPSWLDGHRVKLPSASDCSP